MVHDMCCGHVLMHDHVFMKCHALMHVHALMCGHVFMHACVLIHGVHENTEGFRKHRWWDEPSSDHMW